MIAAASSQAKRAAAAAGAEVTVDYQTEDLKARVREITGGGADLVVDPVGDRYAEPALRSLGPFGRYLVIGFAGGSIPRLPLNRILLGNRTVIGVDWGAWAGQDPAGNRALVAELLQRVAGGVLHPVAPQTYPLERAAEALGELGGRRVTGKLALVPACPDDGGPTRKRALNPIDDRSVRVIVRSSFGFCVITEVCYAEPVSSRSLAPAGGPPGGPSRAPPGADPGSGHGGRPGGADPGGRGRRGRRPARRGRGRQLSVPWTGGGAGADRRGGCGRRPQRPASQLAVGAGTEHQLGAVRPGERGLLPVRGPSVERDRR